MNAINSEIFKLARGSEQKRMARIEALTDEQVSGYLKHLNVRLGRGHSERTLAGRRGALLTKLQEVHDKIYA